MPPTAPPPLFDDSFLRQLQGLRIRALRVPVGGRPAEQQSAATGGGVEFHDVRPYTAGDDLRSLDWHLLQRLDRLFVRIHRREEDLPVHVVVDLSRSMSRTVTGSPARDVVGKRAAAALSWIALQSHDRVRIHTLPRTGAPYRTVARGARGFHALLHWLEQLPTGGDTDLVGGLQDLQTRHTRRGLCVVVSDFLDPRGPDAVLSALRSVHHKLLLLRVVLPGEDRPAVRGPVELVDCEAPDRRTVLHMDDAAAERHAKAWHRYQNELESIATRRGGRCAQLRCDAPVPAQLASMFRDGELVA